MWHELFSKNSLRSKPFKNKIELYYKSSPKKNYVPQIQTKYLIPAHTLAYSLFTKPSTNISPTQISSKLSALSKYLKGDIFQELTSTSRKNYYYTIVFLLVQPCRRLYGFPKLLQWWNAEPSFETVWTGLKLFETVWMLKHRLWNQSRYKLFYQNSWKV